MALTDDERGISVKPHNHPVRTTLTSIRRTNIGVELLLNTVYTCVIIYRVEARISNVSSGSKSPFSSMRFF
jgi:hypothetical protein